MIEARHLTPAEVQQVTLPTRFRETLEAVKSTQYAVNAFGGSYTHIERINGQFETVTVDRATVNNLKGELTSLYAELRTSRLKSDLQLASTATRFIV